MENVYPIFLNGQTIGRAGVIKTGLYYRISCKCRLPDLRPWRIRIADVDLGVCLREGDHCSLRTTVPQKEISGSIVFEAHLPEIEVFLPLDPNNTFAHMEVLLSAAYRVKKGIPGLIIKEVLSRPGNGLSR